MNFGHCLKNGHRASYSLALGLSYRLDASLVPVGRKERLKGGGIIFTSTDQY